MSSPRQHRPDTLRGKEWKKEGCVVQCWKHREEGCEKELGGRQRLEEVRAMEDRVRTLYYPVGT